ncbi:F-box/kelch-repeat protein At3g23880 [Medicago truncatula]|uniref:F-box protein interaction domain protein n=2 Tax=Medicago truncatula TaxID=3880 RepID=A0A072UB50_MEDTR|nr:F-box/kelch-repeat protein At3g23880 [Medicago truncatula]KEH23070.1 F-box protein interaction domain protein [Medicago truncatula]
MDTPPNKKIRLHDLSKQTLFLPDELIAEILSHLSVKNMLKLKCLSKSWNTFISDPNFVQMHLKKSSQNPHLAVIYRDIISRVNLIPVPVGLLLKNPSISLDGNDLSSLSNHCMVVGSCNGLICLLYHTESTSPTVKHFKTWFRFWNPATRIRSNILGWLTYRIPRDDIDMLTFLCRFKFTFGYESLSKTYKVVAFRIIKNEGEVKVFSLGDNCWRDIQSFLVLPLNLLPPRRRRGPCCLNDGVHFRGTINWLAMYNQPIIHVEQFAIVSLDLSTESYKQLQLPPGFNEVPFFQPVLRVLMDGICFYHDSKRTEFVLWHMKEYGVQESWTQLLKISYQNLHIRNINDTFKLVCLYVNGDMVIFGKENSDQIILYNLKDKTTVKRSVNRTRWYRSMDYAESLVSVC